MSTDRYTSSRDLAQTAEFEGGLSYMLFAAGLSPEELPDDMPADIIQKITGLLALKETYQVVSEYLYSHINDEPVPGDWDYAA